MTGEPRVGLLTSGFSASTIAAVWNRGAPMMDILIGAVLTVAGLAFGALRTARDDRSFRLRRLAAMALVAAGLSFLLGIVHGPAPEDAREDLVWRTDVESALSEARAQSRPAILDATADWCAACKELEHRTLKDPRVRRALQGFVCIRMDMTQFDESQERLQRLGVTVTSLPWVGFFLLDGRLNPGVTLTDFEAPDLFARRVEAAATYRAAALTPVEAWLGERGWLWALLLVFVAGIGVSLTPCVYPMIPITLAVVGARGADEAGGGPPLRDRMIRSSLFVFGLAAMYATLGVVSAATGKGFGSWLQHPAVSGGVALLFIALAASYAGLYSLDLPSSWKARLSARRGGLWGVILVGAAAGLVAAPCAGPVVVGVLAVIGTTGDLMLGFGLMFAFALGMGLLFFVLGLSTAAIARLPRQGAWMERVELLFGIAFLITAVYYGRLAMAVW